MLFSDMRCFICGNPPEKISLGKDDKLGLTGFCALKGGLLDAKPYESYGIDICDGCLLDGAREGRVIRTVTEQRPPNIYEYRWNPDGEDRPYVLPPPQFKSWAEKEDT